ncbi:MAG: 16S rRNA (guanine(527)-N(7))-methyltransferase RsmG [Saprospiraceae bacterium]
MNTTLISSYFPTLSSEQLNTLSALETFYKDWNEKINLISRKDMDQFMLHHVLHSLTLAKFMNFKPGTSILDLGTGGGFPGIPLAIFYPEIMFYLIDGTGKKIKVVKAAIEQFNLTNVQADSMRIEDLDAQFDYVTARAVAGLGDLIRLTRKHIKTKNQNARPNGLIAYKGYPLREDGQAIQKMPHEIFKISSQFKEEYFQEKCIVYVPMY